MNLPRHTLHSLCKATKWGRETGFFSLVAGRLSTSLADQILLFFIPLAVYKATGSFARSGLAFAIEWLPRICCLPFGGAIVDRLGWLKAYLAADFGRALACLLAVCGVVSGEGAYPVLIFLACVNGALYEQSFVATEVAAPLFVGVDKLSAAQGLLQAVEQTTLIVGPLLAAQLGSVLEEEALLLVAAALFAASAGIVCFSGLQRQANHSKHRSTTADIIADLVFGSKYITASPKLLFLIATSMLVNVVLGFGMATVAPLTKSVFAQDDRHFGLLLSGAGIVTVLTYFLVGAIPGSSWRRRAGLIAFFLVGVSGLVMGFAPSFKHFAAGFVLLFAGDAIFAIYMRTERIKAIDVSHRGKCLGLIVPLNSLPFFGVGALLTIFGDRVAVQGLLAVAGCVCLIAGSLLLAWSRQQRWFESYGT